MASNSSSRPLLLSLVVALGLAAGLFLLFGEGSKREGFASLTPELDSGREGEEELQIEEALIPIPRVEERALRAGPSTVLWPLKVELRLIEPDFLPSEEGTVAIGSGATAGLVGRISNHQDHGTRAQVRFVAGSNKGRVLQANGEGYFGASDLYPGISIVEVSGPGIVGSRRELILRQNYEQILNISYHRPATVVGWVKDQTGEPIEGAKVRIDGIPVFTDQDGGFSATNVASGINVLLEIEHPEYASKHSVVRLASGRRTQDDQWQFTLREGAELHLVASSDIGGPGPLEVYLLPGDGQRPIAGAMGYRRERFPFYTLNPIKVSPGRPALVRGLPAGSVAVHAFRVGAKAKMSFINLRQGQESVHKIRLESADQVRGVVRLDGAPVPGVEVTLEAPNQVRASLAYLRKGINHLESAVLPSFPAAAQATFTNERGEYSFTAWERESSTRYLEARGPDGKTIAGRFVRKGDRELDLELKPIELGDSELHLDFPGRFQSLPVEVHVNGRPLDPTLLASGDELILEELMAGRWSMEISWHSIVVLPEAELRIKGILRRRVGLIPECIEGQSEEDWLRAGREYPLLAE